MDGYVCIWSSEKADPELKLDTKGSPAMTIRWSNSQGSSGASGEDSMLAAGCQDGQILIYSIREAQLCVKLDSHDRE